MVLLRNNIALARILLMSELVYLIKQCDYNLVKLSVLHSIPDVYQVYYMLDACDQLNVLDSSAYIH